MKVMTPKQFSLWMRKFPKEAEGAMGNAIESVAVVIEAESKMRSPVATGALRNSLTTDNKKMQAIVRTDVNYGLYVHEGTKYMQDRPFMADAVEQEGRKIDLAISNALDKELRKL